MNKLLDKVVQTELREARTHVGRAANALLEATQELELVAAVSPTRHHHRWQGLINEIRELYADLGLASMECSVRE